MHTLGDDAKLADSAEQTIKYALRPKKSMALEIYEIAIIGVVILVFIIYGPKKIPELARALGMAKKEFSEGSQGTNAVNPASTQPSDELLATARKLGISTEGKTREQISDEIVRKGQKS